MNTLIQAYAAPKKGALLDPVEFDPGPLASEQVEIAVSHCGICHSDLSMIDNDWGQSSYDAVFVWAYRASPGCKELARKPVIPPGTIFCTDTKGTGYNDEHHQPFPLFGAGTQGNCRSKITIKDWGASQ